MSGRLATSDFLAPFGWPDSVERNFEVLRYKRVHYPPMELRTHEPLTELGTSTAASWLNPDYSHSPMLLAYSVWMPLMWTKVNSRADFPLPLV